MLVVDGTVLLAWAVQTPHSAAAAELLAVGELAAPQAALAEALEGARRLMLLGHVGVEDVQRLPLLLAPMLHVLAADAPLMERAARLAAVHELPVAAVLVLALAQARQAELATLDRRLAAAARQTKGVRQVRALAG